MGLPPNYFAVYPNHFRLPDLGSMHKHPVAGPPLFYVEGLHTLKWVFSKDKGLSKTVSGDHQKFLMRNFETDKMIIHLGMVWPPVGPMQLKAMNSSKYTILSHQPNVKMDGDSVGVFFWGIAAPWRCSEFKLPMPAFIKKHALKLDSLKKAKNKSTIFSKLADNSTIKASKRLVDVAKAGRAVVQAADQSCEFILRKYECSEMGRAETQNSLLPPSAQNVFTNLSQVNLRNQGTGEDVGDTLTRQVDDRYGQKKEEPKTAAELDADPELERQPDGTYIRRDYERKRADEDKQNEQELLDKRADLGEARERYSDANAAHEASHSISQRADRECVQAQKQVRSSERERQRAEKANAEANEEYNYAQGRQSASIAEAEAQAHEALRLEKEADNPDLSEKERNSRLAESEMCRQRAQKCSSEADAWGGGASDWNDARLRTEERLQECTRAKTDADENLRAANRHASAAEMDLEKKTEELNKAKADKAAAKKALNEKKRKLGEKARTVSIPIPSLLSHVPVPCTVQIYVSWTAILGQFIQHIGASVLGIVKSFAGILFDSTLVGQTGMKKSLLENAKMLVVDGVIPGVQKGLRSGNWEFEFENKFENTPFASKVTLSFSRDPKTGQFKWKADAGVEVKTEGDILTGGLGVTAERDFETEEKDGKETERRVLRVGTEAKAGVDIGVADVSVDPQSAFPRQGGPGSDSPVPSPSSPVLYPSSNGTFIA